MFPNGESSCVKRGNGEGQYQTWASLLCLLSTCSHMRDINPALLQLPQAFSMTPSSFRPPTSPLPPISFLWPFALWKCHWVGRLHVSTLCICGDTRGPCNASKLPAEVQQHEAACAYPGPHFTHINPEPEPEVTCFQGCPGFAHTHSCITTERGLAISTFWTFPHVASQHRDQYFLNNTTCKNNTYINTTCINTKYKQVQGHHIHQHHIRAAGVTLHCDGDGTA